MREYFIENDKGLWLSNPDLCTGDVIFTDNPEIAWSFPKEDTAWRVVEFLVQEDCYIAYKRNVLSWIPDIKTCLNVTEHQFVSSGEDMMQDKNTNIFYTRGGGPKYKRMESSGVRIYYIPCPAFGESW